MNDSHEVTVVVMTRDRGPQLCESLARHQAPVIVVDNGSQDGTPELVRRRFPAVELDRNLGAVARNLGVERARTPYVAFADDDSWWLPGSLDRAACLLARHPDLAVLAARTLVGPGRSLDAVSALMRDSPLGRDPRLPGPSVLGFLACSVVVRRTAFLEAGGFDDLLHFMGEEELLALDLAGLGWALCYVEEVVALHHPAAGRPKNERRARAARNRVLTGVMRRPWPVVARIIADELAHGMPETRGVAQAARLVPAAVRRRRPLSPAVESRRRLLDASP